SPRRSPTRRGQVAPASQYRPPPAGTRRVRRSRWTAWQRGTLRAARFSWHGRLPGPGDSLADEDEQEHRQGPRQITGSIDNDGAAGMVPRSDQAGVRTAMINSGATPAPLTRPHRRVAGY